MRALHYKTEVQELISKHTIADKIRGKFLVRDIGIPGEQIRIIINKLRCEGVPIGSDEFGYFMAKNKEELIPTKNQLKSRRNKIDNALKGLDKCFN